MKKSKICTTELTKCSSLPSTSVLMTEYGSVRMGRSSKVVRIYSHVLKKLTLCNKSLKDSTTILLVNKISFHLEKIRTQKRYKKLWKKFVKQYRRPQIKISWYFTFLLEGECNTMENIWCFWMNLIKIVAFIRAGRSRRILKKFLNHILTLITWQFVRAHEKCWEAFILGHSVVQPLRLRNTMRPFK